MQIENVIFLFEYKRLLVSDFFAQLLFYVSFFMDRSKKGPYS